MTSTTETTRTRITGTAAIEYARAHGLTLSTYATACEPDGQSGLTPDQAEEWIRTEPGAGLADLVYLERGPQCP